MSAPPKKYEVHDIANIFPLLEGPGFDALVEDIEKRGQQEPVWLYEGKILDGRNRYRALEKVGLEALVRPYTGDDPIGFVLSANLHRRHLNESQRAMVGAKLADLGVGDNQHSKEGTSIEVASKLLNVGRASIDRARKVLSVGDPSLVAAVEQGEVSVSAAAAGTAAMPSATTSSKTKKNTSDKVDKLEDRLIEALKKLNPETAKAAAAKIIQRFQDAGFLDRGKKAA